MNPDTIRIRPIAAADLTAFRELRLEALRLHPVAFSADYAVNSQQPPAFWEGRVSQAIDSPEQIIYLAETETGLVGMTGIRRGESPKTAHGAVIWGVYVRPGQRGCRIGERLLLACLDWARGQRIRIVKLGVVTSNEAALRCYTRCGFTTYGHEPAAIAWQGQDYDEYLMSVSLEP